MFIVSQWLDEIWATEELYSSKHNLCLSTDSMTWTLSSALNESSDKYFHICYFLVL